MAGQRLDYEIDTEIEESLITAHAGVPSVIEVFQRGGAAAVIYRTIKFKTRKRGLTASQMVASHLALWSAGGERCEDFDHLRQDQGLAALIGHDLPAAKTARDFLDRLCVQRKLACSAGGRPAGARVRSPVVWIAGWRETKILKPIDKISPGEITSRRAVTTVNANVASKLIGSKGRARIRGAKAAWGAEI